MPDWSYHSLFKPLLFRLPARTAEKLTLGAIGTLAMTPGGKSVIGFMGHMQPAEQLKVNDRFRTRIGLGAGFTLTRAAAEAFCEFGFAYIEIGPITARPVNAEVQLDPEDEEIIWQNLPINPGLVWFAEQFGEAPLPVPLALRIAHLPGATAEDASVELQDIAAKLSGVSAFACIDTRWALRNWNADAIEHYLVRAVSLFGQVLVLIDPSASNRTFDMFVTAANAAGCAGFTVGGGRKDETGQLVFECANVPSTAAMLSRLKQAAPDAVLIAADSVAQPADALTLLRAGAEFCQVYSGFVFAGPGLPKRTNEAILGATMRVLPASEPYCLRSILSANWLGFAAVGIGLIVTSVAAMTVGMTSIILPYDETFVRLQREAFGQISPHLLGFMEHDRVTYAGTAMATGVLFAALSIFGVRAGKRWSYNAVRNAGFFGFGSFLLFILFGYVDPLHAFVTLFLVPFFLWALFTPRRFKPEPSSDLYNNRRWMRALQGQFWFVCVAAGLMLAGVVISKFGFSSVFVPEDLMYMHTTADAVTANHPHLLPAIGHDRAGFGCSLITVGLAVLYMALHGFRQGQGWVWWSLLISGSIALASTLGIHYFIGYTNQFHLAPVYIAAAMFFAGLWLSYPFLCEGVNRL